MKDAESVTFAGGSLDRAAHLRGDAVKLARMAEDPEARALALWHGKPLIDFTSTPRLAWRSLDDPILAQTYGPRVFLGLSNSAPRFAVQIPDWSTLETTDGPRPFVDAAQEKHPQAPDNLRFGDLRALMAELPASDAGDAAAAKGILAWHETHGFCARCGAASDVGDAGWKRVCPSCSAQHFPRTDPVVIMLITRHDTVLLGRAPVWPEGMFSLLAGFMEPGESIEAAVRREVFEEVGVSVGRVDYLSSQPWPFPSSLMIGCHGHAKDFALTIDPIEIEDARWLTRGEVLDGFMGRTPDMRPARKGSIARFLLERWLADKLG